MRIVGGQWRGHPIDAPEGRDVTRPTTDRVREAVCSMLMSARGLDLAGVRVLDAFAGSGAMGLELLSRGAGWVTFVDIDRSAQALVRKNAASLRCPSSAYAMVRGDVERLAAAGRLAGAPFDIVVLDPPYAFEAARVGELVKALHEGGLLAKGAHVLYERSSSGDPLALVGAHLVKEKRYGITAVELYEMEA